MRREVASLYVHDEDDRVLLVSKDGKAWNFPGGVREKGEKVIETLAREIFAEIGVTLRQEPQLISVEEHPSRKGEMTRYHIFACTPENLLGKLSIRREDKVNHFEWVENPLEKDLNPCPRAFLERQAA